jgi:hypothetical protein
MNAFTGFNNSPKLFTNPAATENYKERVTYDPNGNIRTYLRDGDAARISMDNLVYTYKTNSNQLDKVVDAATDAAAGDFLPGRVSLLALCKSRTRTYRIKYYPSAIVYTLFSPI